MICSLNFHQGQMKMSDILVYISGALAIIGIFVVAHILLKKIHLTGGRR